MSDKKVRFLKEFKGGSMARTFLIQKTGGKFVRKIGNTDFGLSGDKLKSQYDWIAMFNRIFPEILPNVGLYVYDLEKKTSHYDMEYIDMGTLRDYFVNSSSYDSSLLHDVLNAGAIIATRDVNHKEDKSQYIKTKHLDKMIQRCEIISETKLFNSPELTINGKVYKNLKVLIEEILKNEKLMKMLEPKDWYRSHGDLTFQNILTDEIEIRVIDPRGEGPDSIYYDISKLFQSCHGKYDLLYDGNYKVKVTSETTIDYRIESNVEKFNDIFKQLQDLIPDYYNVDENWQTITKFFEASHFISMLPFRFKENDEITLICYCIGIQLLNEVLEEMEEIENGL